MARYAEGTRVPVSQSRAEIERILERFGASHFLYSAQAGKVTIAFRSHDRNVRFDLPLPTQARSQEALDRATREKWRALVLAIKAKLSSVESQIETFEEAFYAHVVMGDGQTIYEATRERLAAIYGGQNVPLLPPPRAAS